MKNQERYFKLLQHVLAGNSFTSTWYQNTFNIKRRTANRDISEFQDTMMKEFGIKFDTEYEDGLYVFKPSNLQYVLKGLGK